MGSPELSYTRPLQRSRGIFLVGTFINNDDDDTVSEGGEDEEEDEEEGDDDQFETDFEQYLL